MKLQTRLTIFVAVLASCSFSQASITNAVFQSSDKTKLNDTLWSWYPQKGSTDPLMSLSAAQYQAGSVTGTIYSDTALDPTLTRGNDVLNDTGFAWGAYTVDITMAQTFTISAVSVSAPVTGWGSFTLLQPVLSGGSYVGHIDFSGPAIANDGSELDFSYKVSFVGSTQYTITETFTPIAVPEPGTLGLAALGGLLFGGFSLSRRSRK
jgi:hypothetical protein